MRTLCPNCATAFRITPDQLRARNGMVRCGQCLAVFNAFDSLIEDVVSPLPVSADVVPTMPLPTDAPAEAVAPIVEPVAPVEDALASAMSEAEPTAETPAEEKTDEETSDEEVATKVLPLVMPLDPIDAALVADETPEESTQAARDAGLAAVRELTETPGYNRWASGTLGADHSSSFHEETGKRLLWPFVVVAVALTLTLLAQLVYYYRSELVQRWPGLRQSYEALDIAIPLPRSVDQVTIEASDLQSDNARGLLVLQATLKNRAIFAQAWPALELALTDSNDAVVVRKVLSASDYLPPKADSGSFAGNSEVGIKLWLESKQPAAGYRLYVFYP